MVRRTSAPRIQPGRMLAVALWILCAVLALPSTGLAQEETGEDEGREPSITEGRVPVLEFLKWVGEATGKTVLYPSAPTPETQFAPEVMIDIIGDVSPLTFPVVKAILEMNGYELFENTLEDGEPVISVRHTQSRNRTTVPEITPIVPPEQAPPADASSEQLMTLVLQLEFADTNTVIGALRDLLGVAGRGSSGTVSIVNITSTNTLLIKGKKGILEHVRDIVQYIDRDLPPLPQILEVVEVYNADAQDLSSLITDILNLSSSGASGSTNRTPRPRNRGAGGQAASQTLQTYTRLVPDPRTQKIIVDSTNEEEVELVLRLIDELDTKVEFYRANTHVYRVKYLKAADLADDLSQLIDGATRSSGGLSNRNRNRNRNRTSGNQQNQGQQQTLPTRIVPHDETNSLLIQAEREEFREIETVLSQIDQMRRQVFLEVALVQVQEASALNYTLEFLAGTLDDRDTRLAAMSAFGLSTVNPTELTDNNNFVRLINPDIPQTGILAAVSRDGQLPMLLRAIKTDTDSVIMATPFILADDNQTSTLNVQTEIFFPTSTLNNNFSTSGQDAEEAGITLTLTPTVSEEVVLLEMELDVSSFGGTSSGGGAVPDRSSNTITSFVTIPDGELFVIGGLARETESLSVSKVPLLGDLPLLGRFFQSRATDKRRDNLYIFVTGHIVKGDTDNMTRITEQAQRSMSSFRDDFRVQVFDPNQLESRKEQAERKKKEEGK